MTHTTHLYPQAGDTFVAGWGTMHVRQYEVMDARQVTPQGAWPVGVAMTVREVAVHPGSPDVARGQVNPEPQPWHVCPTDGATKFKRLGAAV